MPNLGLRWVSVKTLLLAHTHACIALFLSHSLRLSFPHFASIHSSSLLDPLLSVRGGEASGGPLSGLLERIDKGVLDGQAPNVEVIADGDNDIDDEASVNTDSGSEHHEHESDLVDIATEGAGPAESEVLLEIGTDSIDDAKSERNAEDVGVRESQVDEMGGDHLSDTVGVDNTGKE